MVPPQLGSWHGPLVQFWPGISQGRSDLKSRLGCVALAASWCWLWAGVRPGCPARFFFFFFRLSFFFFLGLHAWHVEVPRLGVRSQLQLPTCTTATAMPEPSCVCDLRHSSWQHWILNPLGKAMDQTHNLMAPSGILFHCVRTGTPCTCLARGPWGLGFSQCGTRCQAAWVGTARLL